MESRFAQFIKERQYLTNVAPRTIEWYEQSLRWLNTAQPSEADLKDCVLRMREAGLKATGCNCRGRAINAYLKWAGSALRIPKMKEPQFLPPTFTTDQVKKVIGWKPVGRCQQRLHLLVLILLDTGCRISEALDVHVADCDLDNLLMTLNGKGRKQRKVPFSFELRRVLFRFTREMQPHMILLSTGRGCQLDRHDVGRDVRLLCRRLGMEPPARTLHAFRHTFALNYLRKGGSVSWMTEVELMADEIWPDWRDHFQKTGRRLPPEMRKNVEPSSSWQAQRPAFIKALLDWLGATPPVEGVMSVIEILRQLRSSPFLGCGSWPSPHVKM